MSAEHTVRAPSGTPRAGYASTTVRHHSIADRVARVSAVVVGVGFLATVAAAPFAAASGPVNVELGVTGVRLDTLALVLTMLVMGLSALIQAFSVRYLRGDARQVWFVMSANLLTGSTVLLVCAGSVLVFAVAWLGAGASLLLLLATYATLAQARDGVRRTGLSFAIADTALLVGVAIVVVTARGDIALDQLGTVTASLPLAAQLTVAALLVTAALARSSQIPFSGWLPFTLAAPTPVSALMHAGVVNAGAILLLRFSPAIATHQAVMTVIFLAGAATLVYASTVRLVRPDVKGRLVYSTMAQMGFMIMVCGLGLFAAAIFHLVAHSLFKSALFLGAGTGVRHHAVARDLPARVTPSRRVRAVALSLSVIVPVVALTAAKLTLSSSVTPASAGLLAFVALAAGVALASALTTNFSVRTLVIGLVATVALAVGYVAALHGFTAALPDPGAVSGASPWLLVLPGVGLLGAQLLAGNPGRLVRLRDTIYARSRAAAAAQPPTLGVHS